MSFIKQKINEKIVLLKNIYFYDNLYFVSLYTIQFLYNLYFINIVSFL